MSLFFYLARFLSIYVSKYINFMRVVILFTIILFLSLIGKGQTYATVTRNNDGSELNEYKEFYFTGVQIGRYVELKWLAKQVISADYFIIEKSMDGMLWNFVDCIEGINSSDIIIEYKYQDYDILNISNSEIIYYRVIQTDFDGNYYEYDSISVRVSPSVSYILNQNNENVSIYTNDYIGGLLCVTNVFGERIITKRIDNEITVIDLSGHEGVHVIRINGIYLDKIIL